MIQLTRAPQKCVAVGKQFFWEAIDLGGDLRVLDLQLSDFALTGGTPTVTIAVLATAVASGHGGIPPRREEP